jgi:hypothetical protein
MFTENDILARLRAGESIDDIGAEIAEMMNAAVTMKAKEDEEKRKAEEAAAWQMKDAEVLADVMNDYFKKYCGATEDMVNAEGLVAAADELAKMLKVVDKVVETANSVNGIKATKHKELPVKITVDKKTGKDAEDWIANAFADFFDAWGL